MVEAIVIGADSHLPAIRQRLSEEFAFLRDEGIVVDLQEDNRGDMVFFQCILTQGQTDTYSLAEGKNMLRHFIANALAELIVSKWENTLLAEIVQQQYYYFNNREQERILELVAKSLSSEGKSPIGDLVFKSQRKSRILVKLLEYLEEETNLVIDGFIRFRLKDYLEELRDIVDRAVDDLMLEQEYKEFIRLLRYFVEVQEPKQAEIHVLMGGDNSYKLMDSDGEALTNEELEDMLQDLSENEINCEDLLISALISLAPRQVYLHLGETSSNREVVDTIQRVFADRLDMCPGCSLCRTSEPTLTGQGNPGQRN